MDIMDTETIAFGSHPSACVDVVRHASLNCGGVLTGEAGGSGDHTGQMLWPGARALCRAILSSPQLAQTMVIELGAGCGICSTVAGLLVPLGICVTDGDSSALELAQQTWKANDSRVRSVPWQSCVFRWSEGWQGDAAALLLQCLPAQPAPVTVLASECIYPSTTPTSMSHFFHACAALLSAHPASSMLMSYVPREPATSISLLTSAHACGLCWQQWSGTGCPSAEAVGCAASLGEESGAVVLRFAVRQGQGQQEGAEGQLAAAISAVFPDALASVQRKQELLAEAEAMAASGEWGAPPL